MPFDGLTGHQQLIQAKSQLSLSQAPAAFIAPADKKFASSIRKRTARAIDNIEDLMYRVTRPKPLRFEIVPTTAPEPEKKRQRPRKKAAK